ncbi:LysR family transcriptional regulator [bacterium]|nr:LysR family transcriptional regulator [bacterium]
MTLLACQIFSTIAHEGSFARTAEQLHLTPSAISHAVATMEAECGFPLFTRTKNGVTMTAAAENLMPAIQRLLASNESLDQSIAQINGMHKGVLRIGVFNSACTVWVPRIIPDFVAEYPGIDVQIYQGSYADIAAWLKNGTVELGFLSNSCALDLDFEPLYQDPLVCIAPRGFSTRRPGCVAAEELRGQPFVSQRADTDADIQSYLKKTDLRMNTRCYVIDDESMVAMVACGQGVAIMPALLLRDGADHGVDVLRLEPAAARSIGLACLDKNSLSPAARQLYRRVRSFAATLP